MRRLRLGSFLLTKNKIRDIIRIGGGIMEPCKCCGGTLFEVIGNFLKICVKCFTAEPTNTQEQEGIDGNNKL